MLAVVEFEVPAMDAVSVTLIGEERLAGARYVMEVPVGLDSDPQAELHASPVSDQETSAFPESAAVKGRL